MSAWYDAQNDKVFVVAENQRSKLLTQFTAWHELGHAKVNVAGRDEWNRVLRDAYRSDAMFRKLTNQIMAKRADTADKAGRNVVAASEEALVELYAAYKTGEYGVLNQKYGDLRSFVQRVFAALRQVLVKVLGKRFGHLSDYDLADALKNTIQDNQKLARMIDALDKVDLADARKNDDFRLSLDENPHSAFARAVDNVVNGKVTHRFIQMGRTPNVLKMLGLPDTRISINDDVIEKAIAQQLSKTIVKHQHPHNVMPNDLKLLPNQLNNPVAVFKSDVNSTNPNGYVILTELVENKGNRLEPVIAALKIAQTKYGLDIVNIASVYGRSNKQMINDITHNRLFWDTKKGSHLVKAFGLQLPSNVALNSASLYGSNIKTELDLEQYLIQQSFDKTVKRLGGQKAYQEAFDKGDTVLSYRQWVQVRTPEFKAWFGDWENHPNEASKIINEEMGMVYHGVVDYL